MYSMMTWVCNCRHCQDRRPVMRTTMRGRLPRSTGQMRACHARQGLERAERACTHPLGSPQARAPHLGSPGSFWPRAHPPECPGSQWARANLMGSSHSPRAAFQPPHPTKGACRLRSGTIQLQKVCQSASRQQSTAYTLNSQLPLESVHLCGKSHHMAVPQSLHRNG